MCKCLTALCVSDNTGVYIVLHLQVLYELGQTHNLIKLYHNDIQGSLIACDITHTQCCYR